MIESPVGIKHRQQHQRNTRIFCGGPQSLAHFIHLCVTVTSWRMVEIVKFCHHGVPLFDHLNKYTSGNRLEIIRCYGPVCPIHQIAPAPEIVFSGRARFSQPRQRSLVRMGMEVRHPWNHGSGEEQIYRRFTSRSDTSYEPFWRYLYQLLSSPAIAQPNLLTPHAMNSSETSHLYKNSWI